MAASNSHVTVWFEGGGACEIFRDTSRFDGRCRVWVAIPPDSDWAANGIEFESREAAAWHMMQALEDADYCENLYTKF